MRRRSVFLGILLAPVASGVARAQKAFDAPRPDMQSLMAGLYRALDVALAQRDVASVARVMDPQFTTSDPQGVVRNAAQTQMDLRTLFASLDPALPLRVETRLTGLSREQTVLVVRGVTQMTVVQPGTGAILASSQSEFLHAWVVRNGSMTLVRERVLNRQQAPGAQAPGQGPHGTK